MPSFLPLIRFPQPQSKYPVRLLPELSVVELWNSCLALQPLFTHVLKPRTWETWDRLGVRRKGVLLFNAIGEKHRTHRPTQCKIHLGLLVFHTEQLAASASHLTSARLRLARTCSSCVPRRGASPVVRRLRDIQWAASVNEHVHVFTASLLECTF